MIVGYARCVALAAPRTSSAQCEGPASRANLDLHEDDRVIVIIKSTEVVIGK